jgi:hypothetical protein
LNLLSRVHRDSPREGVAHQEPPQSIPLQRAINGMDRVDIGLKWIPNNAPSKIFEGNPRFE